MQVQSLDHLNLTVSNLAESIDWYEKVFDFSVVERGQRDNGVSWAIIRSGEAMLCIYEDPSRAKPDRFLQDQRLRHVVYHWGLRILDREQWLKKVEDYNLELEFGGEVHYAHSTSWYVSDPTGYSIEVVLWNNNEIHFDKA